MPCIWKGHRYVASTVFDACANAADVLPVLVATRSATGFVFWR